MVALILAILAVICAIVGPLWVGLVLCAAAVIALVLPEIR